MLTANLTCFRLKLREYRGLVNRTQANLATYLNLDYTELSNRLNAHKNARLSHDNVRAIVRALAEWKAISTRIQAIELLDLMLCPHFDAVEWQTPPLSRLVTVPTPTVAELLPATSAISSHPVPAKTEPVTSSAAEYNLPQPLSSFIGRQAEIVTLKNLLITRRVRLLTLVGPGGAGKSRLSLKVATEVMASFEDRVALVELAPLSNPGLITQTIASVLGLSEETEHTITDSLQRFLRPRQLLLVLDNCEHLVGECARIVEVLLKACPKLQILATSREALGINGETTFRVSSLALPDPNKHYTLEELASYDAVCLFMERSVGVNPGFTLTSQNAAAVVQLCYQLDGIPLALELAAARTRLLTVEEINTRLADRFTLLTGGSRTALRHQQTLRALIDWSYQLLTEEERQLFINLSVFAGGWTLAAAEAVCSDLRSVGFGLAGYEVLEALGGLVNKSLVEVEEQEDGGARRYYFLETLRQYGQEKLRAGGEEQTVQLRHLVYYARLVGGLNINRKLWSKEQPVIVKWLDREMANLRTVLDYGLAIGEVEAVLELLYHLGYYWDVRGYYSEGRRYMEQAIALTLRSGLGRAGAYYAIFYAGWLSMYQGDLPAAQSYLEEAYQLSRNHPDQEFVTDALTGIGVFQAYRGNYGEMRRYLEQSLVKGKELEKPGFKFNQQLKLAWAMTFEGDYDQAIGLLDANIVIIHEFGNYWMLAGTLNLRGTLGFVLGDYATARRVLEEGLSISREKGFTNSKLTSLIWLGIVAWHEAEAAKARQYLIESLDLILKDPPGFNALLALVVVANFLSKIGRQEKQVELLKYSAGIGGAISAIIITRQHVLSDISRRLYEEALQEARLGLAEPGFDEAFSKGQAMSLDAVVIYARHALEVCVKS